MANARSRQHGRITFAVARVSEREARGSQKVIAAALAAPPAITRYVSAQRRHRAADAASQEFDDLALIAWLIVHSDVEAVG